MNLLSKKLIAFSVILGLVVGYGVMVNNNLTLVNGATVTSAPTPRRITPTPRRIPATPRPSPVINPTIPPGVTLTFNIEKVNDTSENPSIGMGRFRLWATQTGPMTSNGYFWVKYTISGSATNRVDYLGQFNQPLSGGIYVTVGNPPPPPTGTLRDTIYIKALADDLIEGTETVTITLTEVNVGAGMGSATLNIADEPLVTPTPTRPVTPTVTPTPSPEVTPTVTPTPRVSGSYVVIYNIQSDWGNGATVDVTIKNNTTTAVSGWTLAWTFPGNQTITNLWNGTFTQSGPSVSVRNAAHNAMLSAGGGSVNFGFNLNYSGSNLKPTSFTLNGTPCQLQ